MARWFDTTGDELQSEQVNLDVFRQLRLCPDNYLAYPAIQTLSGLWKAAKKPINGASMVLHENVDQVRKVASRAYRDNVRELLAVVGEDGNRLVPSGFHRVFGTTLEWPSWLFEGTAISPIESLPREISLTDDLTILANLADHIGPTQILSMILSNPAHAISPTMHAFVMSAPTLRLALDFAIGVLVSRNPHLWAEMLPDASRRCVIEIVGATCGPFTQLYNYAHIATFACIAQMFNVRGERREDIEISGGLEDWNNLLRGQLPNATFVESTHARLSLSAEFADARNPSCNASIWSDAQQQLHKRPNSYEQNALIARLDAKLRRTLIDEQRLPPIAEIAREEGVSERTYARRLSKVGASYRQRADKIRKILAEDMLRDPNQSITSIARALGFSHSSSFARSYAALTNSSPRNWRERHMAVEGGPEND